MNSTVNCLECVGNSFIVLGTMENACSEVIVHRPCVLYRNRSSVLKSSNLRMTSVCSFGNCDRAKWSLTHYNVDLFE